MKRVPSVLATVVALLALLALAACGGGGGGLGLASGGTSGTGISAGGIQGFGSVIVNGVHYDVSRATITSNGEPASEADLEVGMIVRVEGRLDDNGTTGTATRLVYDDQLKGPVSGIDVAARSFTVLGTTVLVLNETAFQGGSFETLALNQIVEVSGYFDADGRVRASFVRFDDGQDVRLEGRVSALDPGAKTFRLGTQSVSYSGATLSGFPDSGLAEGQWVEAEGRIASGVLVASQLEREDGSLGGSAGARVELEGYITQITDANAFVVNGQSIVTTSGTVFEHGSAADLTLNARVEVTGQLTGGGELQASKIEFEQEGDSRLVGQVSAVDAAAGTLSLLGVSVTTTGQTFFEDRATMLRPFGLADIRSSDWVQVEGYVSATDGFVATAVARKSSESRSRVEGASGAISGSLLTVAGVQVAAGAGTEFRDQNGDGTTQSAFFSYLQANPGTAVEARGPWNGAALDAERLEIER